MDNERKPEAIIKCDVCGSTDGNMWPNPERTSPEDPEWLCAEHMINTLRHRLDTCVRLLDIQKKDAEPLFPILPSKGSYSKPYPTKIPWSIAELAYSRYAHKYGKSQSLERLAERGGFGPTEMDDLYPGWIVAASEIFTLRQSITDSRSDLVERDQEIFILKGKLRVLGASYDELAYAVGWNRERCTQQGDSPMDVARELMMDVKEHAGAVTQLKAELDVAIRKIFELTKGN